MTPEEKLAKKERRVEALQLFSARIRECAEEAGLSQTDIAAKLKIKGGKVGNWFQGLNYPKGDSLRLADLLGVPVSYLLRGVVSPPRGHSGGNAKPTPINGAVERRLTAILSDIASSTAPPTTLQVIPLVAPAPINRVALHLQLNQLITIVGAIPGSQIQLQIFFPLQGENSSPA